MKGGYAHVLFFFCKYYYHDDFDRLIIIITNFPVTAQEKGGRTHVTMDD